MLSQVDGRMTLEEIAEIAGLDFGTAAELAQRLEALGALSVAEPKQRRRSTNSKPPRRAKSQAAIRSVRVDARAETVSIRPAARRDTPPEKPRKSLRMGRVDSPPKAARVDDDTCDLDQPARERIAALDARLGSSDYYALLEVVRMADKKIIKRALFRVCCEASSRSLLRQEAGKAPRASRSGLSTPDRGA